MIIKLSEIKGKERILNAARKKKEITYKGVPIHVATDFSLKNNTSQEEVE